MTNNGLGMGADDGRSAPVYGYYAQDGWHDVAVSTLPLCAYPSAHRLAYAQMQDGATATYFAFEDGQRTAIRSSAPILNMPLTYVYYPDMDGQSTDTIFDDIVVRKYVTNEPTTVVDAWNATSVSRIVDPALTFAVAARTTGDGACNHLAIPPAQTRRLQRLMQRRHLVTQLTR